MSRLVTPPVPAGTLISDATGPGAEDNYQSRLIKYIPAESLAFYIAVDKVITAANQLSTTVPPGDLGLKVTAISWGVFLLGLIGTPIYLYNQRTPGQPWRLHATLGTIAFACWAYSTGGSVFLIERCYDPYVAAVLAPAFTFIAGFFQPRPQ